MSVLMVLRVPAEAEGIKKAAQDNKDALVGISERAKGRGAIHHAFYAGEGEVLVVDEWDSSESFQAFFADEAPNIGSLMQAAGAQGEPGPPRFYEKLELGDEF